MFENVLIAEDQEIANLSLRRTIEDLDIPSPDYAHYCDQALSQIKRALQNRRPYDLLVTDLYFESDDNAAQLPDGAGLIRDAKALQPSLKVLVFSAESRLTVIQPLFDELNIDGFVRKARSDAKELKAALERLAQHRRHYPRELRNQASPEKLHTFTEYDKAIIRLLADGYSQKQIPAYLSKHDIRPSGLSSMEKRLNFIKTSMGFTNNEQMVAFCKEMKVI
jgi:DNA-binding NarL/FixJ family response regulator